MLRFETSGAPFDRGRRQGEMCRDLATPWFERQLQALGHRPDEMRRRLEQAEAAYPGGVDECRGIAAGMRMAEDDYFTVIFCALAAAWPTQCTTVGFRTAAGRPLLGKTDDIGLHELGMNVLEITRPDRGHRHAHFHFACSIWTVAGMNEHGLSIAMTGVTGPTLDEDGVPSLVAILTPPVSAL